MVMIITEKAAITNTVMKMAVTAAAMEVAAVVVVVMKATRATAIPLLQTVTVAVVIIIAARATALQTAKNMKKKLQPVMTKTTTMAIAAAIHRAYLLHMKCSRKMTSRPKVFLWRKKKATRKIPIQTRIFPTGH